MSFLFKCVAPVKPEYGQLFLFLDLKKNCLLMCHPAFC